MTLPLVDVSILSIYSKSGTRSLLPARMAKATPDMKKAIYGIRTELEAAGGRLVLSDLFRSYDMQLQAYLDYKNGKKTAFSPPPGGSMHESGRAFDLELESIKIPLKDFWTIAQKHGVTPVISSPVSGKSESWHFERHGSHKAVYDYYKAGKGTNFTKPAAAMAASAIVSIGQPVDFFNGGSEVAFIQSALIRLGKEIGNIDAKIGPKTRKALSDFGINCSGIHETVASVNVLLQEKYPEEFFDSTPVDTHL